MRKTMVLVLVALLAITAVMPAMAEECSHDFPMTEVVVNYPNCEASGRMDIVCSNCKQVVDSQILPAIGHDWQISEEKSATCSEAGCITYTCAHTDCYATKTEYTAKLEHEWVVSEEKAATCSEAGYTIYACARPDCSETKTTSIAQLEHEWVFVRTVEPAACEKKGFDLYKCTLCSEYKTVETAALTHEWTEVARKDPTCTECGYSEEYCANCQATKTTVLEALGHSWTNWVVDQNPGCTTQGMRTRYCCRDCCYDAAMGKAYKETEVIEPYGHKVDEAHSTKNADGSYTGTCIYCSQTVTVSSTIEQHNTQPETRPQNNSGSSASQNKTGTSSSGVKIPATGAESNSWAYGMMLVSAVILVALTAKRRALQK